MNSPTLRRHVALFALLLAASPAIAADTGPVEFVDAFNKVFGQHRGVRANHAKAIVLEGVFAPSASASSISKAAHFQNHTVPITVRFSNFGGIPDIPDNHPQANPRGLSIKFHLPNGGTTDIVLAGHRSTVMAADERTGLDAVLLADLEPDRMWSIYRRYRLQIVGQRDDRLASAFAGAVVDVLARFLPTSRAQLARAADSRRVGVLIGTNQQDVAIMRADSAEALFLAKPPFDDVRNVPLRQVVSFGSHILACRSDFMASHAYLVAQTLIGQTNAFPTPAGAPEGVVPAHRGSRAFFAGEEMRDPAIGIEAPGIVGRGSYS